jgi:hypothetical protein
VKPAPAIIATKKMDRTFGIVTHSAKPAGTADNAALDR